MKKNIALYALLLKRWEKMRLKKYIFKELFYVQQGLRLFDVFYFNTFWNVSYFCDIKAQFSASLLLCHVILHNSYAYLMLKKHFSLLSVLKTVLLLNIFVDFVMNRWLHSYQIKHSVWWHNFIFGWTVPLRLNFTWIAVIGLLHMHSQQFN